MVNFLLFASPCWIPWQQTSQDLHTLELCYWWVQPRQTSASSTQLLAFISNVNKRNCFQWGSCCCQEVQPTHWEGRCKRSFFFAASNTNDTSTIESRGLSINAGGELCIYGCLAPSCGGELLEDELWAVWWFRRIVMPVRSWYEFTARVVHFLQSCTV